MKNIVSQIGHKILLQLIWILVRTFIFTYRFRYSESNDIHKHEARGTFIFAIWHEQMIGFLTAHAWTHPYLTLASKSKDGDYAAFVSSRLGFTPVRGSSKKKNTDKGGKEAIEEYIQRLNSGTSGGITVDGPKGPRHFCKIGIAKIAQQSGRPIIPGVAVASRYWTMRSWDKFKIPKPFSTITVTYSAPIWVDKEATDIELAEVCKQVENKLTTLLSSGD